MSQDVISTYCPACGKAFRVPPDLQGKKILCKNCQTHFLVQADKPGIPAAPPPTGAPQAVPATPPPSAPRAPAPAAAPIKAAVAPPSNPPVTAATTAPAPAPPVVDELAPIPFDDSAPPVTPGSPDAAAAIKTSSGKLGKVKIESKGPYFVVKLVMAGKMVHVNIEDALNEHAEDGWRLEQVLMTASGEAYAILHREPDGRKASENSPSDHH